MKKMVMAAVIGMAFSAGISLSPASASAQSIEISQAELNQSVTSAAVEKDFWSDLVDGITGREDRNRHDGPPSPPPGGPHHGNPPPPPGGPHHGNPPPPPGGPHHGNPPPPPGGPHHGNPPPRW